jgi:hypothetical protein
MSADFGATWDMKTVASMPSSSTSCASSIFPVTAVDTAGTIYVVWSASNGLVAPTFKETDPNAVYLSYSTDQGDTWSKPLIVSDPTKDGRLPWIVAGKPGRVAISWYESTHDVPGEYVPDEWNVKLWETVTADSTAPQGLTSTLNTNPNHLGAICTGGIGCTTNGDRSLLDFFEITLNGAGQPVATWMSSTLGTGLGTAVQGPDVHFGGISTGTPFR